MPAAIAVREDFSASSLRRLAARSRDANQSRRLLALAAILDGMSRGEAARIGGMDRQSLRDWVIRFNAEGPEGLVNRASPGRRCWLSAEQLRELSEVVETGPDRERDGVVRWRRVDLKRLIAERFGVVYAERSISRLLADLGFVHISARPQHPAQDEKVIAAFKKTSPARSPHT
jgi:transposase